MLDPGCRPGYRSERRYDGVGMLMPSLMRGDMWMRSSTRYSALRTTVPKTEQDSTKTAPRLPKTAPKTCPVRSRRTSRTPWTPLLSHLSLHSKRSHRSHQCTPPRTPSPTSPHESPDDQSLS